MLTSVCQSEETLIGRCHVLTMETRGRNKFTNHSNEGHLKILILARWVTENQFSSYCLSAHNEGSWMGPNFSEAQIESGVTVAS